MELVMGLGSSLDAIRFYYNCIYCYDTNRNHSKHLYKIVNKGGRNARPLREVKKCR